MADLTNEEKNEKIRIKWLELIEQNEKNIANKMKEDNLQFDKFLALEKIQKKEQELKKRIEDGFTPDELPLTGWERVDGKVLPLTEDKAYIEEIDQICIATPDLKDDEKSLPKQEIQKKAEGGNKLIGRFCKLFSRK